MKCHNLFYLCFTHSIKKASQFLERPDFSSSGDWTRTSDLRVMSPTSYLLLYPAMGVFSLVLQLRNINSDEKIENAICVYGRQIYDGFLS